MEFYLLYTSESKVTNFEDINKILITAMDFNSQHNITGILLYDSNYFLQILEGDKQELINLYNKISKDKRHTNVSLKLFGEILSKNFNDWAMRLSLISNRSILPVHKMHSLDSFKESQDLNHSEKLLSLVSLLICEGFQEYKSDHESCFNLGGFSQLTKREVEVLALFIRGSSPKEIGRKLNISDKTVSNHIDNIRAKLNCTSSKNLIKKVFDSGYIMYLI